MEIKLNQKTTFLSFGLGIIVWLLSIFFVYGIAAVLLKAIVLTLLLGGVFSFVISNNWKLHILEKNLLVYFLMILGILLGILFNNYTWDEILKNYLILFFLWSFYSFSNQESFKPLNNYISETFYWFFLVFIIFNLFVIKSNSGNYTFDLINDQNFTGLMIFLFFTYSWHFKRIIGILPCLYFITFLSSSRGLFGMLVIFFFCIMFRNTVYSIIKKFFAKIWRLMLVLFIFIMGLSIYWIGNISTDNLSNYREGLNDGSNKMRFSANVYSMDLIKENDNLWLSGYGSLLKQVYGIEEDKPEANHARYNGVRLVQPHNSFLNLFIKMGIIPGVIYLFVVSIIIDKLVSRNTIEFIIPYFINASFMHSFFNGPWFVLWLLILYFCKYVKRDKLRI
ncbi:O-antigen ligase family protein [uncultured Veillonella sp.]|uniref:O-antigen ligase family protein n=1 Tax=uncultured Veillonella sp. TaxID=159268 RepID=UPI0025FA9230|nr:O-antigen ligase family protein [uncultured Veillonella sp.]MDY3973341.1 O-antigen ligase family protein [Veillonella caviae]